MTDARPLPCQLRLRRQHAWPHGMAEEFALGDALDLAPGVLDLRQQPAPVPSRQHLPTVVSRVSHSIEDEEGERTAMVPVSSTTSSKGIHSPATGPSTPIPCPSQYI